MRTVILYVFTGSAFAIANLLLARALPKHSYGTIALAVALINFGSGLAPFGLNGVVIRQQVGVNARLLMSGLAAATLTGTLIATTAKLAYGIHGLVALLVGFAIAFGGVTVLSEARFRVLHRFSAILLVQSASFAVLAAAAFLLITESTELWIAPGFIAALYCVTAISSWTWLLSRREIAPRGNAFETAHWKDAAHYAGLVAVAGLFLQLERLVVPAVLSLGELASFGVVAALVMSPYRILQLSTSYTLLPRLSALKHTADRRRVLRSEVLTVASLAALGGIPIWFLAPAIIHYFVGNAIPVSPSLLAAAIFGAIAKLVEAVARTAATALCATEELAQLGFVAWIALGIAIAGAWVGSRWGLPGVIYGVAVGSGVRTIAATRLARPHLAR